jgi:hypothetical protein
MMRVRSASRLADQCRRLRGHILWSHLPRNRCDEDLQLCWFRCAGGWRMDGLRIVRITSAQELGDLSCFGIVAASVLV